VLAMWIGEPHGDHHLRVVWSNPHWTNAAARQRSCHICHRVWRFCRQCNEIARRAPGNVSCPSERVNFGSSFRWRFPTGAPRMEDC